MPFSAGAIVATLELNSKKWEQSIARIKGDQASLSGYILRNEASFRSMGKAIGIAGAAIVASFGAMIKKTADYGDEMDEMHQRTGVSVELLTGLDGALKKNGASAADLAGGLRFLSTKMVDANSGNKVAIGLFDALGISVTDANGKLRSTEDVLFDVANKFSRMEEGAVKTNFAVELLGRGGMSLIPTLNLGADGLKREAEEARRLGKVMTQEAAKACSDFNDRLVDLKGGLQGVGIQIGTALMPVVKELVEKITGVVVKVREWAAEHPELASGLSKVTLGLGGLMMAMGPVIYALPGLIKGLTMLKAIAAIPIVITIAVAIPVLTKAVSDFKYEMDNFRDAMKESGASGFEATLEGINSGIRKVFFGIKDSNIILSEMNALSKNFAKEGGRGVKDILLEEKGALDGLNPALSALGALLKELGIKTRTELTAELKAAKEALNALRGSAEATPGQIKALEEKIIGLKEAMSGAKIETKSLAEQLGITFKSETESRIKKLNEALLVYRGKMTEEQVAKIRTEIEALSKSMTLSLIPAADAVAKHIDSTLTKLEDMVLGAMREIEKAGDFTVENMASDLNEIAKNWETKSKEVAEKTKSIWQECSTVISDAMRDIARSIVDAFGFAKSLMYKMKDFNDDYYKQARKDLDADYEYRRDKLSDEYEGIYKTKRRQYEDARDLIEQSTMDEGAKREALKKLDRDYEDWLDLAKKQEKENLLAIEKQHQLDLDKIRKDEDTARQKHADDELERQNSLWEKVKGIFGTACENMATIFLTKMFEPVGEMIAALAKKLTGKGKDELGGALDDAGGSVKNLGKTIGEFIGGIGKGIGEFIEGLATGIAKAARVLAAAAPDLIIVGAIALALYAGFTAISRFIGGAGGGAGAGDGMGRVVERQDQQTALLTTIKNFCTNNISLAIQWIGKSMDYLWEAKGALNAIANTIGNLRGAQAGAVSTQTELMMIHGTPSNPEYIIPASKLAGATLPGPPGGGSTVNINIQAWDGEDVDRFFRTKGKNLLLDLWRRNAGGLTRATEAYASSYR